LKWDLLNLEMRQKGYTVGMMTDGVLGTYDHKPVAKQFSDLMEIFDQDTISRLREAGDP